MRIYLFTVFLTLSITQVMAKSWIIDKDDSKIEFIGSHSQKEFKGVFNDIDGEIEFDPKDLENSFAKIEIGLSSAMTGDQTYDKTMPQQDWFNVKSYPVALFQTTKILKVKGDSYRVEGYLTIKGVRLSHNFNAKINIRGNDATLYAKTRIKRLSFGIGQASDSSGDWVSLDIPLTIKLNATSK
jgi:polyisoprenoid-binding protein YceI